MRFKDEFILIANKSIRVKTNKNHRKQHFKNISFVKRLFREEMLLAFYGDMANKDNKLFRGYQMSQLS
jgi:hypothetical protein